MSLLPVDRARKIRAQVRASVAATIGVPIVLLWGMLYEHSAATPTFVICGLVFLVFVSIGRWDIAGYYVRILLLVLFLVVCFRAGGWIAPVIAVFLFLGSWLIVSRPAGTPAINMSFPLSGGWFCVVHGGIMSVMNPHVPFVSQRYAIDIVRLNSLGFRARGLVPPDLASYPIFSQILYSPCEGTVTAVVDDLPDLPPGAMDRTHPAGNHIVIRCSAPDVVVGLAHLAQGSILVRPGASVSVGQPLARVGNSGNTSEPHLHIHAKRRGRPDSMLDGEGVPMRFHGRWLIRNSLVRRRKIRLL